MAINNLQIVCKNDVEPQYVEMMVPLYSYGCEKKMKKALSHLKGIYSVNVDYSQQKVTVWGICNKHDVLSTIRNKRKQARFWNLDDNINNIIDTLSDDHDHDKSHDHNDDESGSPTILSLPPKRYKSMISFSKTSLALSYKARSLSWKALKRVFTRSYSL